MNVLLKCFFALNCIFTFEIVYSNITTSSDVFISSIVNKYIICFSGNISGYVIALTDYWCE